MDSLGIYISVPFCRSKCTYCNFASGVHPAALHPAYMARLCADIECARQRAMAWGAEIPRQVDSIYLGGGTPGILSPALLRQLWRALREEFDIMKSAEITLECAPGQLDNPALDAMVEGGVNRVSFGVQSFVDREAAMTGRLHTREIALTGLDRVRSAGIERINIDLIAGLPQQTQKSWRESLETLTETGVEHASVYMLEVDEESRLGRELLAGGSRYHAQTVPGEELTTDLYETAITWLREHGLWQYEISNFARPGRQSRHNEKYWRRQPYLGFGLDAHSLLRRPSGSALRFQTSSVLEQYLGAAEPVSPGYAYPGSAYLGPAYPEAPTPRSTKLPAAPIAFEELSPAEEMEEAWFLGLRLREGVKWETMAAQFGLESVQRFLPVVGELCQLDLLEDGEGVVRLTRRGMLFSNDVFARFLGVREERAPRYSRCETQAASAVAIHPPFSGERHPSAALEEG